MMFIIFEQDYNEAKMSDTKSVSSFSDNSIMSTDISDNCVISRESSDVEDIREDIILMSAFFTLIDDNVCNDIYLETNITTDKDINISCKKNIRLKDDVILTLENTMNIHNSDVKFEGGTIVFDKGFVLKRDKGRLIFKDTKFISYNDFIVHDGYTFENTKIESYSDNVLIFDNKESVILNNVIIDAKVDMNSIFNIINTGNISFSKCTVIGDVNVNYGVYISLNRLNNEVNIRDTYLGERTINYKQYVLWEFMLGIFTSTISPSYVACSYNNLDVIRSTDDVKISDQLFREIKLCFGSKQNNQITLRKRCTESVYFDINELNDIIGHEYFGNVDKNILNTNTQKYFSLQYNYPMCKSIFVGDVKCEIYFSQQSDSYVLPKPITFNIRDDDKQHLTLTYNKKKMYDVYEDMSIPLNLSFKYENILPIDVSIACNYDYIMFDKCTCKFLKSSTVNMMTNVNKETLMYNRDFYIEAKSIFNSTSNTIRVRNNDKKSQILTSLDDDIFTLKNSISVIGKFNIDSDRDIVECYTDVKFYMIMRGIPYNVSVDIESNDNFTIMNKEEYQNIDISSSYLVNLHIKFNGDRDKDLLTSRYGNKKFNIILTSKHHKNMIQCTFKQEDKILLRYNDKYLLNDIIMDRSKEDIIQYDIVYPYVVNKDIIGRTLIAYATLKDNKLNHVNSLSEYTILKDTNSYSIIHNFNDDNVLGQRHVIIRNMIGDVQLPKITVNQSETSERGFDVYINDTHCLSMIDTHKECRTVSIKSQHLLHDININNKDYKIKGTVRLKSKPLNDYRLILIGTNNVKMSLCDNDYMDRIVLEFNNNKSYCDFNIDVSNIKKSSCDMTLMSYLQPKKENKYDYDTFIFDTYNFITIKVPNINFKEIQCSSIMLGNWKIECDDDGNLVFKRRDIDSVKSEDFKIINSFT